ncbi:universal stress protein [Nocardioides sp. CN2-186]|uniref:universal stress protein n=1 Tax=Nocardioides tweenelious TaxID=3156607 RepID=UPI0032B54BA0
MVDQQRIPSGTIVVGVDSTQAADQALAWAIEEARAEGLALTLVHATGPAVEAWVDVEPIDLREVIDATRGAGRAALDRAGAEVRRTAPEVEVREVLRDAGPHDVLMELARDAAMLVIGSHSAGVHDRPVIESAVGFVSAHAPCPVVVPRTRGAGQGLGVVVVCDGTPESAGPLEYACRQAARRGLAVTVLHSLADPIDPGGDDDLETMDETARMEAEFGPCLLGFERILLVDLVHEMKSHWPDIEIRVVLEDGAIDDCLGWVETRAQMLVVGAHHVRRASERVIGSSSSDDVRCVTVVLPQADRVAQADESFLESIGIELPETAEGLPEVAPETPSREVLVPVRVPIVRRIRRTAEEHRELPDH